LLLVVTQVFAGADAVALSFSKGSSVVIILAFLVLWHVEIVDEVTF